MRAGSSQALPAILLAAFATLSAACGEKAVVKVALAPPPPETVFVKTPEPKAPPKPPLDVSPRSIAFNAIGDTTRLTFPAGSQCVAAMETIAHVDSTGLVKADGNGDTHLRCWLGDQNASIKIKVSQTLARVQVVADEGLAMRKSGDSLHLSLARVDRLGTPVDNSRPTWASLAPDVIKVDPSSGVVTGVADTGTARIVGTADQLADTVIVEVGAKSAATQLLSANTRTSLSRSRTLARANAAQRAARFAATTTPTGIATQAVTSGQPVQQQASQQQNPSGIGVRGTQPQDSLFRDPATGDYGRGMSVIPALTAGFAEYRIETPTNGLEKTSGAVYGGQLTLATRGLLTFRFNFLTGTLAKDTNTVQKDRKMMSGAFDAGIAIAPWLNVVAGVEARRFEDVSVQRWIMVRAGGEADFSLGGGGLHGIARLLVVPVISIASDLGNTTSPSFGINSALGLGFDNRRISTSLVYDIERYSFPSNTNRKEQFGALLFRFGYRFGW